MAKRSYGQYCGLARALELVGERWALLVVRDLLVGPKRFGELQRGLPKVPSNILAARLRELEDAGVVRRRAQPRPARGLVYELTEDGRKLEPAVIALGLWGARRLGDTSAEEVVTQDSLAMALRSIFQSQTAPREPTTYELRVGDLALNARVANGRVTVGRGALPQADLTIETGPEIRALFAGEVTPRQAVRRGLVRLHGKRSLLDRFAQSFCLPAP